VRAVDTERVLGEVAAGQWGLVTVRQAAQVGVSRLTLSRLAGEGVLVRLAQGVYVLRGAAGADHLELRAAWVALDPARPAFERLGDGPAGPVVSHASAADLFGFGDLDADRFEFTAPIRRQVRRGDVRMHRSQLDFSDVTRSAGLPVTTPERTVVDLLASGHDGEHVAGVLAGAVRARRIDTDALAVRLAPLAAAQGFDRGDGEGLLEHLLELGGAADQVAADQLVGIARGTDTTDNAAAVLNRVAQMITNQLGQSGIAAALAAINAQAQLPTAGTIAALAAINAQAQLPTAGTIAALAAINAQAQLPTAGTIAALAGATTTGQQFQVPPGAALALQAAFEEQRKTIEAVQDAVTIPSTTAAFAALPVVQPADRRALDAAVRAAARLRP